MAREEVILCVIDDQEGADPGANVRAEDDDQALCQFSLNGLAGVCNMLCKYPYMKNASGGCMAQTRLSQEARDALTPFPCGQCMPCLINKRRTWYCRMHLEASTCGSAVFVTLTYDDDHLPENLSVSKKELQKYIKRLRKKMSPITFRFFGIGEYGTEGERYNKIGIPNPHYHLALFGLSENAMWEIEYCWRDKKKEKIGRVQTIPLTPELMQYLTGYISKKLNRPGGMKSKNAQIRIQNWNWLQKNHPYFNPETMEWEFAIMSKQKGGLGLEAVKQMAAELKKSGADIDHVVRMITLKTKKLPLGRYLTEKLFEELDMDASIKQREYVMYQEQFFQDFLSLDDGGIAYYMAIVEAGEQKRKSIEIRQEMNKKRRNL